MLNDLKSSQFSLLDEVIISTYTSFMSDHPSVNLQLDPKNETNMILSNFTFVTNVINSVTVRHSYAFKT